MNFDDLIEKKLVLARPHGRLPITLYKYHRKVFYKGLFTQDKRLRWARGIVLDDDGKIVTRPFYKYYNYGENHAGEDWNDNDMVLAVEKINGFMISVSRYNGELIFSSTGTFDSDYVELGKRYIMYNQNDTLSFIKEGMTCVFEICATEDPHIINEKIGPYLIGVWRRSEFDPYDPAGMFYTPYMNQGYIQHVAKQEGFRFAQHKVTTWGDVRTDLLTDTHEGWMVYNRDNPNIEEQVIKLKSPYYLVTKLLARHALHKDHRPKFDKLRQIIDEEYYDLLNELEANQEEFFAMDEQARIAYIRAYFNSKE